MSRDHCGNGGARPSVHIFVNMTEKLMLSPENVNTTPQLTRFRGAKVFSKWLQGRVDDHNIQSDYKCTIGLKVQK